MPMIKTNLVNGIMSALAAGSASGTEAEVANKLADAIDTYIKSATVTTEVKTVIQGATAQGPILPGGQGMGTCMGTIS